MDHIYWTVYECKRCNTTYSNQDDLNQHLLSTHGLLNRLNQNNYKCLEEGCDSSFKNQDTLVNHLQESHNLEIETENIEFSSTEDFNVWKKEIEVRECCNYIKPRGKRVTAHGNEVVYFICNRSVSNTGSRKKNTDRKRSIKSQGLCKLNTNCISQIKFVKESDGKVIIKRQKTHYGHGAEIQHLRLPKEDRAIIASKLLSGESTTRILDLNRNKIGSDVKRIDLLTRTDIANIKRSYKLDFKEVNHSDADENVDQWVQDHESDSDNPTLFYKQQNEKNDYFEDEDFCLILMNNYQKHMLIQFGCNIIVVDSNHDLNGYEFEFELITIMVVDDFGEGFPVAFMFTNKNDTLVYEFFFSCVKKEVGNVSTNVFMSDIAHVFYNAWLSVMGETKHQLYCSWHVDRDWQSNLTKIKDEKKKNLVYKTLKVLQNYLDSSTFKEQLNSFSKTLLENSDTQIFGTYFQKQYLNNYQQWATCYRQQCGINTNMRLESMHRSIKYFYLHKNMTKRFDKGLHSVSKYLSHKIQNRIIKFTKRNQRIHIQEIKKRHQRALKAAMKLEIVEEDKQWTVVENNNYSITKVCDERCCDIVCELCDICIHSYTCTCSDFFLKSTICKHIHFMILETTDQNLHKETNRLTLTQLIESYNNSEENVTNLLLENDVGEQPENMRKNITNELSALLMESNTIDFTNISQEYYSQIMTNLGNIRSLFSLASASDTLQESDEFVSISHSYFRFI